MSSTTLKSRESSRVIPDCGKYQVCITSVGLTVQLGRKGIRLAPDHPQYHDWVEFFDSAVDSQERVQYAEFLLSHRSAK